MIYVEILGRMGNQMYSYAFARKLQLNMPRQQKDKIAFDFTKFDNTENKERYYALGKFKCDDNIVLAKRKLNLIQRFALKLYYRKKPKSIVQHENKWRDVLNLLGIYVCTFNACKFKYKPIFKNLLVLGFYTSHEFFNDIDDLIREEYSLKEEHYSPKVLELIDELDKPNSVCVSVRRGDYASPQLHDTWCLSVEYYSRAIAKMSELVSDARFFFFSDDIEWVEQNIKMPENYVLVKESKLDVADYEIIHIKSHCKNYLLANSSYAVWALYLCEKQDKVVVAPRQMSYKSPELYTGIYEDDWILEDI